ncbi:MAG TPA: beta-propeller fold lactonase family protein [bacterium]
MPEVDSAPAEFHASYLYVAYDGAQAIGVLRINQDSGLVTQAAPDVFLGDQPSHLLVHPTLPYLYVTSATGGFIDGFEIDPYTGNLTEVSGMPVILGGESPRQMALSPDGMRMSVANGISTPTFRYFDMDPANGVLNESGDSPMNYGSGAANFIVSTPQDFVYIGQSPQTVAAFSFAGGGANPIGTDQSTNSTDPFLATATSKNLYVMSQSSIDTYFINPDNGALIFGNTVATTDNNGAIVRHPSLKVLYVSPALSEDVEVYPVDDDGLPASSSMAQIDLIVSSRFMFGPAGRLYVANPFGDGNFPSISSFRILPDGTLSDRVEFFTPGGVTPADAALKTFSF